MSVCNSAIPGCRDAWTTLMMGVEVLNGRQYNTKIKSPFVLHILCIEMCCCTGHVHLCKCRLGGGVGQINQTLYCKDELFRVPFRTQYHA